MLLRLPGAWWDEPGVALLFALDLLRWPSAPPAVVAAPASRALHRWLLMLAPVLLPLAVVLAVPGVCPATDGGTLRVGCLGLEVFPRPTPPRSCFGCVGRPLWVAALARLGCCVLAVAGLVERVAPALQTAGRPPCHFVLLFGALCEALARCGGAARMSTLGHIGCCAASPMLTRLGDVATEAAAVGAANGCPTSCTSLLAGSSLLAASLVLLCH